MALFRKTNAPAEPDGALTPAEAVAGIATLAMYADGIVSAEEDDELAVALARLGVFRALDDRAVRGSFQRVQAIQAEAGDAALLERCSRALPQRLRPTAFLVAADLVMTDGEIAEEERQFLERIREALGVDPSLAQKILDVLALQHVA